MTRRIKLIVDRNDGSYPVYLTVDATDKIEIIVDEEGVTARSDGERFDTIEEDTSKTAEVVFDNQLTLFDSTPWKL